MSAYPRVRETKVRAAFEDEFERLSLMNHTFKIMKEVDGVDVETEVCVGELFEENKLLMDLFDQPSNIRALIRDTIEDGMVYTGKYSHFHFIKFCNKHDLKRIVENVDNYVKMLSR